MMQIAKTMPPAAFTGRTLAGKSAARIHSSAQLPRFAPVLNASAKERADDARERGTDDNPAEKAAIQFEKDVVEPFVAATNENSGLDESTFNKTASSTSDGPVGAFEETQSFAGLAPEIINGRAAMVGFLAAAGAEIATRQPVLTQIQKAPLPIIGAFALIIIASIVPIVRGADLGRKGAGPFTPRAEVWNGRLAMMSFATLLLVETFKGGPGVVP